MALNILPPVRVDGFVALERQVRDVRRSVDFYVQGLGFEWLGSDRLRHPHADAVLALGDERIALHRMPLDMRGAAIAAGPDVRFQHVALVTPDIMSAYRRLECSASGAFVPITRGGPQCLPASSGGAAAFKFRDPDGHPLELIEFIAGALPARWRRCDAAGTALTWGIDHAAISVASVERSIAFYTRLGFSVAARQVNAGAAQARLDGLDTEQAEVEVVSMKLPSASGPHVELLGYRQPAAFSMSPNNVDEGAADAFADRLAWHGTRAVLDLPDPDGHLHHVVTSPP